MNQNFLHARPDPRASIIIVTFERLTALAELLETLEEQRLLGCEILVVDNNADEMFLEPVRRKHQNIGFLRSGQNLGAAEGRNFGLRHASAELCVFIDDDAVILDRDFVSKSETYFAADDRLAGLAFAVLTPEGDLEIASIPRFDKKKIKSNYSCAYFSANGCAFRRSALTRVNAFWDKLFIYGEELDLSYRLLDAGLTLRYVADIRMVNTKSMDGRVSGRDIYFYSRNRCWISLRNLPWRYVVSHVSCWWALMFYRSLRHGHVHEFFRGVSDAIRSLPFVLAQRRPIKSSTVKYIRSLSGRLIY